MQHSLSLLRSLINSCNFSLSLIIFKTLLFIKMGNKKSKEFQQEVKEEDVEIFNKEHMTNEDYEFFSSLTNFSKEQIKSMFEIFMENNPTGELNKRDFMRLYCSLRPEPNEIIYKISAHVFGAFDIGNSLY